MILAKLNKLFLILVVLFSCKINGQNIDINILKEINLNRNTKLDKSFIYITHSAAPMNVITPVYFIGSGLIIGNNYTLGQSIFIAESVIFSNLISTGLKYAINRERPFLKYPELEPMVKVSSPSFPSGHTTSAFALATAMSIAFPKWYVIAPAFIWASLVAYSRIHLGVHYPLDVVAGIIVGCSSALLSLKLNFWLNKKFDKEYFFYKN